MIVSVVSSPVSPWCQRPHAPAQRAARCTGGTRRRPHKPPARRRTAEQGAACPLQHCALTQLSSYASLYHPFKYQNTLSVRGCAPLKKHVPAARSYGRCTHRAPCARAHGTPSPPRLAPSPARTSPPLAQARTWAPTTKLPTLTWPPSSAPYEPGDAARAERCLRVGCHKTALRSVLGFHWHTQTLAHSYGARFTWSHARRDASALFIHPWSVCGSSREGTKFLPKFTPRHPTNKLNGMTQSRTQYSHEVY